MKGIWDSEKCPFIRLALRVKVLCIRHTPVKNVNSPGIITRYDVGIN